MAVITYRTFYSNNFGPNYLCNVDNINIVTADSKLADTNALAGLGNSQLLIGTGCIGYTQASRLLPKGESGKTRVQPFTAYTYKNVDVLRALS